MSTESGVRKSVIEPEIGIKLRSMIGVIHWLMIALTLLAIFAPLYIPENLHITQTVFFAAYAGVGACYAAYYARKLLQLNTKREMVKEAFRLSATYSCERMQGARHYIRDLFFFLCAQLRKHNTGATDSQIRTLSEKALSEYLNHKKLPEYIDAEEFVTHFDHEKLRHGAIMILEFWEDVCVAVSDGDSPFADENTLKLLMGGTTIQFFNEVLNSFIFDLKKLQGDDENLYRGIRVLSERWKG